MFDQMKKIDEEEMVETQKVHAAFIEKFKEVEKKVTHI